MNVAERITKRLRESWARNSTGEVGYHRVLNRRGELRSIMRDEGVTWLDFDDVLAVASSEAKLVLTGGEGLDALDVEYLPEAHPVPAAIACADGWPLDGEPMIGGEA